MTRNIIGAMLIFFKKKCTDSLHQLVLKIRNVPTAVLPTGLWPARRLQRVYWSSWGVLGASPEIVVCLYCKFYSADRLHPWPWNLLPVTVLLHLFWARVKYIKTRSGRCWNFVQCNDITSSCYHKPWKTSNVITSCVGCENVEKQQDG